MEIIIGIKSHVNLKKKKQLENDTRRRSRRHVSRIIAITVIIHNYLGIEFYLFVSHEGMKRQRFHV